MRGKKVKRLRRQAEEKTIGQPLRATAWLTRGKGKQKVRLWIVNLPGTTRQVYRALKKKA